MPKECGPGFLIQENVTQSRLAPTSKTEMISGVDKSKNCGCNMDANTPEQIEMIHLSKMK